VPWPHPDDADVALIAGILKSNLVRAGVTLALAAVLVVKAGSDLPYQFGIDFYQFWGVPLAKRAGPMAQSPYVDGAGYARVLNGIADASSSAKLHAANAARRELEPMGTPFLYASFAAFPDDYERAQRLFTLVQYLAAGIGVFVLARLRGLGAWLSASLALLVELTFWPFLLDVKVGNVNSLQLAFMAGLLYVAVKRAYTGRALVDGLFIGALALLVVFKPNTPWIALAFALHYGAVHGARRFLAGAAVAAVLAAGAWGAGAWFFHDAGVWGEWLRLARGMNATIPLTVAQGNMSLAKLLSDRTGMLGPMGFGLLLAGAMSLALALALSSVGLRSLGAAARRAFSDPWFAASIGVLFTFATSPLVWPHYLLLALVPIFWLVRTDGRVDAAALGAIVCYVALSAPFIQALVAARFFGAFQAAMLFAWCALIPGTLAGTARLARAPRPEHA
jgi:hypothetical protein